MFVVMMVICCILAILSIYLSVGLLCLGWFERRIRKLREYEYIFVCIGWPVIIFGYVRGFIRGIFDRREI